MLEDAQRGKEYVREKLSAARDVLAEAELNQERAKRGVSDELRFVRISFVKVRVCERSLADYFECYEKLSSSEGTC